MTAQRDTLKAFTDAAADAVARAIAGVQREAQREREIRDAEHRARLAELDTRIASAAAVERRIEERLATLKDGQDGKSVSADEIKSIILESVEAQLAALPRPKDGADGKSIEPESVKGMVDEAVAASVAAMPAPRDGKDADPEEMRLMVQEAVRAAAEALPPPQNGKDADPADVERIVSEKVAEAISALPPPVDGKSVDPADVEHMIQDAVRAAVDALPPPLAGKDADPEIIRQMVIEAVAEVPRIAGPAGKLPMVKAWQDQVYYESDAVTFEGRTYQAQRDTGRAPPHDDWLCIAERGVDGEDGKDGRSFRIRGTFDGTADYAEMDVVALNGAAFVAKRDNPGQCPGEDWQMIAAQGKRGQPMKGDPGKRGDAGPPVVAASIDADGMLTLVNGDGSKVNCDLYPVLSRLK